MEAILHKIQNFITGFMLVNSNLAKAVEFIEYGTYISLAVVLLGLLGFFGLARKNNPLVKAVGAASLFALFPAWFIIGEMGLIGLLAVILIVSIVLNRQSPDTRGRNFLMSSMLAGFAISVVSFFIGFTYLREGNQIDPAENGVYGLAPFMTFLFSFLIFSRREKKAARAEESFMEDQWQPSLKSKAQNTMNTAYASGAAESMVKSNVYPSDEERLPSLEELFSKGVDEQSFNTIFDRSVEKKDEEKPLVSEVETDYSFLDTMKKENESSEPVKAVEEKIEEPMAEKATMSIGSILAPAFDGRDDEFLSSRRKEEVKINFFESEQEEAVSRVSEEKSVDPTEVPVAKSDLSQTLVFDDMAEQIESEAKTMEDEATIETVIEEATVQTVKESVEAVAEEIEDEATGKEVVSEEAMTDVEEFEVEIVKLDFLEPNAEELVEPVAEVAEEVVEAAEEMIAEEPVAESEEVEIVKLDFLEPNAEESVEPVAEVAEEVVTEAAEEMIAEEPVAESEEV
ncbi:MAG: DMT family transporter, partial [Peptostreptococcaceae bacterium]|nr:DMT family transporter [Peptostreptococcaceae bacterium]